jgi:hypothetical protein
VGNKAFQPPYQDCEWPEKLRPIGDCGGRSEESFGEWWDRCGMQRLGHLPKNFVEQWVYRHWDYTVHRYFDLERIKVSLESWLPDQFLSNVASAIDEVFEPESDLTRWSDEFGRPTKEPLISLLSQEATWDYPPIVFGTANGFFNKDRILVQKPFMLIEGHTRRLALNALVHRGLALPQQPVFVIQEI